MNICDKIKEAIYHEEKVSSLYTDIIKDMLNRKDMQKAIALKSIKKDSIYHKIELMKISHELKC